eukprot:TRINITY_DN19283_c0_g1_i1.p1 TRINITY_DN19283_c0_g1~~TRINITY_DN19283_c0_g1_i1.p1  ORF type:complete len:324 (+),score=40.35 TRINITY_DN19283_c0_g1_i1:73-972(+)
MISQGTALPGPNEDVKYAKVYEVNPVSKRIARISRDVLLFLQSAPEVTLAEKELIEGKKGFESCVDHPRVPNHVYFEGYFHSKKGVSETFRCVHPRRGFDFQKPAISPKLKAFIQAFRDVNSVWIKDLELSMLKFGESSRGQNEFTAELVRDRIVSDLAVQVHYGDEIDKQNVGWHVDAPNSLLHLAISIKGERYLHSITCNPETAESVNNRDHQTEGDIYITTPSIMRHGVEYPACNFDNRIIAIQCRFLLTEGELGRAMMDLSLGECSDVVAAVLSRAKVRVPTMEEVMKVFEGNSF